MDLRSRWRRINAPLWASAAATLLCAALYVAHRAQILPLPGLDDWERTALDARFRLRGVRQPRSDGPVVVGLDDRTRSEYPHVFQTRRGWAELLRALGRHEPRLVAIDAFFANPEVNLSAATVERVREALALTRTADVEKAVPAPVRAALEAVDEETRGDEVLARAVADVGTVALGVLFDLESSPGASTRVPPALAVARVADGAVLPQPPSHRPPVAGRATASMPTVAAGTRSAGHVNIEIDPDGVVRRVPLVIEFEDTLYQALGVTAAAALTGGSSGYASGDETFRLGDSDHPVDSSGRASINFFGPRGTVPVVSAADLLSGATPEDALRDRVVLVGYTDRARDTIATPFDPHFDGVELHATLAHNLAHGELLRAASPRTTVVIIAILGALITLLQLRRLRANRPWLAGAGLLGLLVAYAVITQLLFTGSLWVVEFVAPALAAALITLASQTSALATEGRERAKLREAFSHYVQATLVDRIVANPERVRLGGERRELTVLFSDIRGFSSMSEGLEPEVLSDFLNEYLTPMTHLVMERQGMLDKYIGDAVMAVFGAPLELADHASRACGTALAMQRALDPLNEEWERRGLPRLAIGIGINTGIMSVGNMGSEARFDYTVLGDSVNLGARLEGLTKEYGVAVLVGETTAERAGGDYQFRELDFVRVKGRHAVARIYELTSEKSAPRLSPEALERWDAVLAAYRAADWDGTDRALDAFLAAAPGDPAAPIFRKRVQYLRDHPPDSQWDGVFEQLTK